MDKRILIVGGVVLMVLLLVPLLGGIKKQTAAELDGFWTGQEEGRGGQWSMDISGGRIRVVGPAEQYEGKIVLDTSAVPKRLECHIETLNGQPLGVASCGIYELDGDAVKIAQGEPGSEAWPTSLSSSGGAGSVPVRVFSLTRTDRK